MVSECVWGVYSSIFLLLRFPAVVCFFSPFLGLGGANLLTSSTPKSTQLQIIEGWSTTPPIIFKGPLHSSSPHQYIVNLHVVMVGSLKQDCIFVVISWVTRFMCFSCVAVHRHSLPIKLHPTSSLSSCVYSPSALYSQTLQPSQTQNCLAH